jgi:hypothetical protein
MTSVALLDGKTPGITVLHGDSSEWTALGTSIDSLACGRRFDMVDICTPDDLSGGLTEDFSGHIGRPFAIVAQQVLVPRCTPAQAVEAMYAAMADAAEYQTGSALWSGVPDVDWTGDVYLTSAEVETTTLTGTSVKGHVAQILKAAWDAHPELDPILHLGIGTALEVGLDVGVLGVPYVVNPGYPINGIAVTDKITIRLGDIQRLNAVDTAINRRYVEATRLGLVEFDPCLARLAVTT